MSDLLTTEPATDRTGIDRWGNRLRLLALQACVLLLMLAIAVIASVGVDLLESLVPRGAFPDFQGSCAVSAQTAPRLIAAPAPAPPELGGGAFPDTYATRDYCAWEGYGTAPRGQTRTAAYTVTDASDGSIQVNLTMQTASGGNLASAVEEGQFAGDPAEFVNAAFGLFLVNSKNPEWGVPTIAVGSGKVASITVTGTIAVTDELNFVLFPNYPASLSVSTKSMVVAGVTTDAPAGARVTQSTHSYAVGGTRPGSTADFRDGYQVSFVLEGNSARPVRSAPTSINWWLSGLSTLGRMLGGYLGALLPAAPWIAAFLACRMERLKTLRERRAWRRLEHVLGIALLAHVAISAAVAIASQEGSVTIGSSPFIAALILRVPGARYYYDSPLHPSGFYAVPGATILLMGVIIYGLTWWAGSAADSLNNRSRWPRIAVYPVAGVAAIAGMIAWWGYRASVSEWLVPIGVIAAVTFVCLAGMAWPSVLTARMWLYSFQLAGVSIRKTAGHRVGPSPHYILPLTGLLLLLAVAGELTWYSGVLPIVLRWAVVLVVGGFMGMAVVGLVLRGMPAPDDPDRNNPPDDPDRNKPGDTQGQDQKPKLSQRILERLTVTLVRLAAGLERLTVLIAVFLAAALLAVPWGILHSTSTSVGWWSVLAYALRLDDLLPVVLLVVVAFTLRELGSGPVTSKEDLKEHRLLGILIWFIALSASYTFAGGFTWPTLATIVAAAAGCLLLFPKDEVDRAAKVLSQSDKDQASAVEQTVRAGAARRLLPAVRKAVQDDLVKAQRPDVDAAHARIKVIEEAAMTADDPGTRPGEAKVTAAQRGFGSLPSRCPWDGGVWGAGMGAAVGAPWVLLGLAGTHFQPSSDGYQLFAVAAQVAPLMLRWTGYGFAFGYFYPLLRGRTGLSKAVFFAIAAAVAAVASVAIEPHSSLQHWLSITQTVLQIMVFASTLGILADRRVLRHRRLPAGRLVDLHDLWTVSTWVSSIGATVATGIATVVLAGLSPFVTGVVTPSVAPSQITAPAPTATPSPSASPSSTPTASSATPSPATSTQP